jgi:hypothetical protein
VIDVAQLFPRRGEEHPQARPASQRQIGEREAIHARHHNVDEERLDFRVLLKPRDGLLRVGRLDDVITSFGQHTRRRFALKTIVLADQNKRSHLKRLAASAALSFR